MTSHLSDKDFLGRHQERQRFKLGGKGQTTCQQKQPMKLPLNIREEMQNANCRTFVYGR